MKYILATLLLLNDGSVFADGMFSQRDIAYAEPKHERQTLDVYARTESTDCPIVFWIHGGGWQAGDKTSVQVKPHPASLVGDQRLQRGRPRRPSQPWQW